MALRGYDMAYGDMPEEPAWMQYRPAVYQKCPFCQDAGCQVCSPKVRGGKSVPELLAEAEACVKSYCALREHPNVWGKLGDLERMLIVYSINFGREDIGDEPAPLEMVDRFKELELR